MKLASLSMVAVLVVGTAGCLVQQDEKDASKFRQAIPSASEVTFKEPVAKSAGTTPQHLTTQDTSNPGYATYYTFTRQIFDGVNLGTTYILTTVWYLANLPPTTVTANEAIWGPGSEALSPAEWRFRATELSQGEFEYALEGRAKGSSDAFQPVLKGIGYGQTHPKHKEGWFELFYDTANQLDPARLHHDHETGTTKVTYQLTSYPTSIVANLRPSNQESFDVAVETQEGGGGLVDIRGTGDIEDANKDGRFEAISMHSRWVQTGAGRADVTVSGGSLGDIVVEASECWSQAFSRTYYTDNHNINPTTGDAASCSFATAEYR